MIMRELREDKSWLGHCGLPIIAFQSLPFFAASLFLSMKIASYKLQFDIYITRYEMVCNIELVIGK